MTAVLYILMRNDLASLNPGKAMAQAAHASDAFNFHFEGYVQEYNSKSVHNEFETASVLGYTEWKNSTRQGFGTVLVLEAKMKDIQPVIDIFKKMDYVAGVVHDPTYPLIDGEVVHFLPIDTCAYVFVPNKEQDGMASMLLSNFMLHK